MIKVDVLVDMLFEVLEERIKTLEKQGKIVNKKVNDVDSFYISQKEVSEVFPETPEPYVQSNPEALLTLATPNLTNLSSLVCENWKHK